MKNLTLILTATLVLTACDMQPTSTQIEAQKQEQMKQQADQSVGMPAINNWSEKKMMKNILELRDRNVTTITYIQDMQGKLHFLCDSVGYGLPYSTQYTNPSMIASNTEHGYAVLPQADPNGLYSPASAEGTWVMCLNPATKELAAVYIEPRVIVSPFTLPNVAP